ncbi:MAG TPA: hypothetical protein VIJ24_01205 [Verrucomicrobiae bacterium]
MSKANTTVTLPEGVSLRRVAEVLVDAWEAGSHRWTNTPLQLREGPRPAPPMPVPQDAMELFRLLHERRVNYLLVGGMAMLTYVQGRNTKDVDLLMSVAALEQLPELTIEDRKDFFARGKFRSIQVDLLLAANPLFKIILERFATRHPFEELSVPTATVEGMIVLKLFALPSLYRQMDMDRAAIYEADIKMLLARHKPEVISLFKVLEPYIPQTDLKELQKIVSEEQQRVTRSKDRFKN